MDNLGIPVLVDYLDEKSKALLLYLWWHRHADIQELRCVIEASSDYEIIHYIRDVINVKSTEILGKTIIDFEESKLDPVTGKKILFHWWLKDDTALSLHSKKNIDAYEERDHYVVIIQIPGSIGITDTNNPLIEHNNGVIKIAFKKEASYANPRR